MKNILLLAATLVCPTLLAVEIETRPLAIRTEQAFPQPAMARMDCGAREGPGQ